MVDYQADTDLRRATLAAIAEHRARRAVQPLCEWCQSPFVRSTPTQRFCSSRCRYAQRDVRPEVKARQARARREKYAAERAAGVVPTDLARRHGRLPARRGPGWVPPPVRGPVCTVEECDKPHEALGLCRLHYRRARWAAGFKNA